MARKTENHNLAPLSFAPLRRMVLLILVAQVSAIFLHLGSTVVIWSVWGPVAGTTALCLPVIAELFAFFTALDAGIHWYVWSAIAWACLALLAFTQHRAILSP